MGQVVKVFFKHTEVFYSAYVTIVNEFDTNFIFIEFLDEAMIGNFNTTYLSYIGEKGFKKLNVYRSNYLRPIISSIGYIINNAQQAVNNSDQQISDEDYICLN